MLDLTGREKKIIILILIVNTTKQNNKEKKKKLNLKCHSKNDTLIRPHKTFLCIPTSK